MAGDDPAPPGNVMIAERVGGGHRWMYVGVLQRHLENAGVSRSILTSKNAIDQPETREHLGSSDQPIILPSRLFPFYVTMLWKARRLGATTIVIPDADLYLPLIIATPRSLRRRLRLLIMRPVEDPPRNYKHRVKSAMMRRLQKSSAAVFTLTADPNAAKANAALLPEPVELSTTHEPEIAGLFEPSRYWFGIFGTITKRKNADLVLSALMQSSLKNTGLILGGRLDDAVRLEIDQVREQAEAAGVSVVTVDRFLSDSELDTAIRTVDCVVIAHSNEASSGILVKARQAGTSVIGAGATSLRAPIRDGQLGIWCECTEAAIQSAMEQVVDFQVPPNSADTIGTTEFASRLSGVVSTS